MIHSTTGQHIGSSHNVIRDGDHCSNVILMHWINDFWKIVTDDASTLLGLKNPSSVASTSPGFATTPGTAARSTSSADSATSAECGPTESSESAGDAASSPAVSESGGGSIAGDSGRVKATSNIGSARGKLGSGVYGQQYVSHTKRILNGDDYVEEHREKVTGWDGATRTATRRRPGDHWYENEIHIDKDSQKTERETWHNLGDEDIEGSKVEWSQRRRGKSSEDSREAGPLAESPDSTALEGGSGSNESGSRE
jgi:hypothetical protein